MISDILMFVLGMLYATMLYEIDREMRRADVSRHQSIKGKDEEGNKVANSSSSSRKIRSKESN